MSSAFVPVAAGAVVLLVPPLRHRAASVAKVAITTLAASATDFQSPPKGRR